MHNDISVLLTVLKNISKKHSKIISKSPPVDNQFWYLGCDLQEFYSFILEMASKLNCIPNTTEYFYMTPTAKFLDVGCGTGINLLLATALGFDAYGIENDPAAIKLLETVYDGPNDHIIQGDALEYKGYGDFDVIFCYRPFSDETLEAQLEHTIIEQMKPGAVLKGQYLVKTPLLFRKE